MSSLASSPSLRRIRWARTYRVINTRFPPVDVFERIADPEDWDALIELEMMTNPRVRDQTGEIALVPIEERVSGPGASWAMAPFTHIGWPSRFTDGTFGVYYAGRDLMTALKEKAHHLGHFLSATNEPLGTYSEFRAVVAKVDTRLHDVREGFDDVHEPDNYTWSQAFAKTLRDKDSRGLVYRSVRHEGGECLAAFTPKVVGLPIGGPHLRYRWDGAQVDSVFNFSEKKWIPLG